VRVALTDVFPAALHSEVAAAAPADWTYELASDGSEETRMRMIRDADFLFCGGAVTTDEMLESATRLRLVQKLGAGFNNINVDLCKEKGIGVARLAGNNAVAVAEHTLMVILAIYRNLRQTDAYVRSGGWSKDKARETHREVRGKVVGIVGFGHVGREVAKRLRPFEVELLYYGPFRVSPEVEASHGVEYVSLDELMQRSDIVTLHAPLFPETQAMINRERIRMMRPGGVLINCARGGLVDEPALIEALQDGHLSGAGLDCFAEERAGGSEAFWGMENVVLSPHIAGASTENFRTMMQRAFGNAQKFLAGEPLPEDDVVWLPEESGVTESASEAKERGACR